MSRLPFHCFGVLKYFYFVDNAHEISSNLDSMVARDVDLVYDIALEGVKEKYTHPRLEVVDLQS